MKHAHALSQAASEGSQDSLWRGRVPLICLSRVVLLHPQVRPDALKCAAARQKVTCQVQSVYILQHHPRQMHTHIRKETHEQQVLVCEP